MGQNYASQSQNPAAVIHWYKYFAFQKYFHFMELIILLNLKYDRVLILDMFPHFHCYCRTPVTATPSTPSTRTSRSAPRCSTSAGGGAADGRLCGSAKTVTPSKVKMTHGDIGTIDSNKERKCRSSSAFPFYQPIFQFSKPSV